MVDQDFKQPDKLTRAHSILGLIVVILGVLQPIIGTIADRLFDPNRSKTPVFPGDNFGEFKMTYSRYGSLVGRKNQHACFHRNHLYGLCSL